MSLAIALEDYSLHQGPKEVVVQHGERVKALRSENQGGKNWNEKFARLLQQLHALSHEVEGIDRLKLELKDSKMELEKVTTLVKHWESQAQNFKASLDGKIAKWKEEKDITMEKENATLMISLQELQIIQQKGREKEIHQQKQMETLEAQLASLWPILRHEKETKLIKCFRTQTHFHNCGKMQRSKSQHPKCHKYKNYKDKES
jgi:NACalpha-BTF3-like transcription factor